jgi:hypothetical protein
LKAEKRRASTNTGARTFFTVGFSFFFRLGRLEDGVDRGLDSLQETVLGGKKIQGHVGLGLATEEAGKRVRGVLVGVQALLIDVRNVDLHRRVVLRVNQTVRVRAAKRARRKKKNHDYFFASCEKKKKNNADEFGRRKKYSLSFTTIRTTCAECRGRP